jgi:dTDP-glucose 4,6-dehydratase
VLVHYNSRNQWGWLETSNVKKEIEVVAGDIRDYDSVRSTMKDVHTVFHLAALIGIPYSYTSPLAYIKTNVEGTYNLLSAARISGTVNILVTSTSEVYGTAIYVPINEEHPLVAQSPYAATKIAADQLALSFFHTYKIPVKIVRPFNAYGPRQSARAVIPTIILQIFGGRRELSLGNLSPTRDLTYVTDTVNGFIEIAQCDELFGKVTQIGLQNETSIEDLVADISKLMQVEVRIDKDEQRVRPGGSEVERLVCDNSRLIKHTSWKPRYDLKSGLRETISWFEQNPTYYKANQYNI